MPLFACIKIRMAISGSGLTTDLTYTTEKIRMYIVSN